MYEYSKEPSVAEKVRQRSFHCTGESEARNVMETCAQVERMADLALGRMESLYSRCRKLPEQDFSFRPGLRELAMAAHSNQLREKKILDMGRAVTKAIEAIGEIQRNADLLVALRKIREGKGDKTALKIVCKELDDLERKNIEG